MQQLSENGLELIAEFEGFRSEPYLCPANVATIGYGTTVYPNGLRVSLSDKPISKDLAKVYLLDNIHYNYEKAVNDCVKVKLSQNQFDSLVSFVYNVGVNAFRKSTLLKKLNANLFNEVPNEFARWTKVNGKDNQGLINRRNREIALFLKP